MTTTYEAIKAIPGKGYDWDGLVNAVRAEVIEVRNALNYTIPYEEEYAAAKGVRDKRNLAMMFACIYVDNLSRLSHFIPPSQETLNWGGFLGGEHVTYTDEEKSDAATAHIVNMIERFRA